MQGQFFLHIVIICFSVYLLWKLLLSRIFQGVENVELKNNSLFKVSQKVNQDKHACKCYMENLSDSEQEVADMLARSLSYEEYYLFNNIILYSSHTISTQIDHVVVSRYGIFIIENKDYGGWIYGTENNKQWTCTYQNGEKYPFQNPIHQNYLHTEAVKRIIPFVKKGLFSVVVFSNRSEFKTVFPKNIVHSNSLVEYLKSFKEVVFSKEDLYLIVGTFACACQTVNITEEEHIKNIQKIKNKTF